MEVDLLMVGTAVSVVLVLLTTILIIYKLNDKKKRKKRELIILFIDAPDPDNPAAAAAIMKHVLMAEDSMDKNGHLHIVLTGRPVDLSTPKETNRIMTRQKWETSNPLHAQRVLEDGAARLQNYLTKCNINVKDVTIYDGGVAPCAPLSDAMHDWDFLFDRKDLMTSLDDDCGEILTPHEYKTLVNEISALSNEQRVQKLLSILRSYTLSPLSALNDQIVNCSQVVLFLGGPATALITLFHDHTSLLQNKVISLHGMFGSLYPGKKTLLSNQFNIACDIEAACELLIDNKFIPNADKYLITTETAKNDILIASADDFQEAGLPPYFVKLHRLWESTHSDKPQPLFDVIPVMAFVEKYRKCFKWFTKKAVLYEWKRNGIEQQIFSFVDSDNAEHPLVSDTNIQYLDKQQFLNFMQKTWT